MSSVNGNIPGLYGPAVQALSYLAGTYQSTGRNQLARVADAVMATTATSGMSADELVKKLEGSPLRGLASAVNPTTTVKIGSARVRANVHYPLSKNTIHESLGLIIVDIKSLPVNSSYQEPSVMDLPVVPQVVTNPREFLGNSGRTPPPYPLRG